MNLTPSLAQLQRDHVIMELECIDRMYCNAYVPKLTSEPGVAAFFRPGQWPAPLRGPRRRPAHL
jgi:hypothetical protein